MRIKLLVFFMVLLCFTTYGKQRVNVERTVKVYSADHKVLLKQITYRDGYLDGPYIEYYPNGNIRVQGEYYMGLKANDWFEYSPAGKLIYQAKYLDGLPIGPAFPIEKNK